MECNFYLGKEVDLVSPSGGAPQGNRANMDHISKINIRPGSREDLEFILSLVPRLAEFGPPEWRDVTAMINTDLQVLRDQLLHQSSDTAFFIAEDERGIPLGFVHLERGKDYYYLEKHGHIANVIVAQEGEGRGIGRMLIEKGEEWAKIQGYRWLTISVFAQNLRAREVYQRLGYGEDIIKYVKELD
jgi:GNAT superfamily N-acetyltransferase